MICTLAEIKADLGLADTVDDAVLQLLIDSLEGRFESHLNRSLLRTVGAVELFDGGEHCLLVARFPVETVTSVHQSADQTWDATTLLDGADGEFIVNYQRGRLYYGHGGFDWPWGVQNIRVVYTGGYVAGGTLPGAGQTAMPDGIRHAFKLQCAFLWRNWRNLGSSGVSSQGTNINLSPVDLLPEVKQALAPFIRYG